MKNEYTITKKLMKSWAKGWWFNSADNMFTLLFACFFVAVFFFLPYLFINYCHFLGINKGLDLVYSAYFVMCHTASLLFLFFIPFVPRIRCIVKYRILCKNYNVKKWQRVIELTEDEIIVTDHKSISKYQYRTIKRVKERGNVVHIFLKSGTEIIIHKDAFVIGSWEKCKSLISRKSSVKIK